MGIYEEDELLESYVFRICKTSKKMTKPEFSRQDGLPRWVLEIGVDDSLSIEECQKQTVQMIRTMSTDCVCMPFCHHSFFIFLLFLLPSRLLPFLPLSNVAHTTKFNQTNLSAVSSSASASSASLFLLIVFLSIV